MSFAEATLWTIGSVVAVVSLYQNGIRFFPAIQHDPGASSLLQVIAYLALLLLMQFVYFPKTKLTEIFALRPAKWMFYPIAALLGVAILFPTSAIYEAALARWPADEVQGTEILKGFWTMPVWRKVVAGAGLCLVTPLVEEVMFRGALFGTLRRRHSAPLVVLMTASLFAMVHLQSQILVPIAIVGAALAFLRVASGSIWPGVVLHVAFNSLSFYSQVTAGPGGGDDKTPTWQVLAGTVVTAGLLALAEHLRTRKVYTLPDIQHPVEPPEEEER
ncbi:MAG: type II CAAX endopeptidase family protein [Polyangiaceae bacterium]